MNPLNLFLVVTCLLLPGQSKGIDDFFNQGISFLESRQYDEAIKSFSDAIAINPQHAVAYCNRGVAWFYKGDYDRAISDYNRALAINPRYTGAYCNRGVLWTNKGDYDRAISDYKKALDINAYYAPAYCGRGIAWFRKGDYDRAIADYNRTIDINPHYTLAYCNRGALWAGKGDYDRAIADCTRALDLNPYSAMAYCNRGVAWFHKSEYFRAIADYLRAIDIDPYHTQAYNHLAWTLAICPDDGYRDGAKAMEMAQKAVELNPKADFLATLAAACAEAGKFGEAITTQKRVITLLHKERKKELLDEHMERLKSYKAHESWRKKYAIRRQKINNEVFRTPRQEIEEEASQQLSEGDAPVYRPRAYPYTVQVSSNQDKEISNHIAAKSRMKGDLAFTSYGYIPGKGDWYRVFVGYYENSKEARKAALKLKGKNFPDAFAIKKPYVIQVGLFNSDQGLKKLEVNLQSKGYMAYSIPIKGDKDKIRLLIGAFGTKKEAAKLAIKIQAEGFKPSVVLR